ncbi:MAG: hypothetical protein IJ491_08160 [Clostridia bacterium]|nr:hypothetical protein [Clostridia bacterium]
MAYIPTQHEKYNLLPFCRKNGLEVFDYPSKLLWEIDEYIGIDPYGYNSYDDYFKELDKVAERFSGNPEAAELLRKFKSEIKRMNIKEEWSVVKYTGPTDDKAYGLTQGKNYYWPTSKDDPVYHGVIDDEEYTSYIYPTDRNLWEILEDPTGMAYDTIYKNDKENSLKKLYL